MNDDRVPCTECDGGGKLTGIGCDRRGPSRIVVFTCPECGGTGKISAVAVAMKRRGETVRDQRLAAKESLRQAAVRFGIPMVELGEVERGTAPLMLVERVEALWRGGLT